MPIFVIGIHKCLHTILITLRYIRFYKMNLVYKSHVISCIHANDKISQSTLVSNDETTQNNHFPFKALGWPYKSL